MNRKSIEKIISTERFKPYLRYHSYNFDKALLHYKSNIAISESFYSLLAILEVGLRNNISFQLEQKFNDTNWFDNSDFKNIISNFQINRIIDAKSNITIRKKRISIDRIIPELTFGFWTSFFDPKYDTSFWKNLRLAFPNCPKEIRKRKTMNLKFNGIRKLRNRIFHHESISWNSSALINYKNEIIEGINWLDKELLEWTLDLFKLDDIITKNKNLIK